MLPIHVTVGTYCVSICTALRRGIRKELSCRLKESVGKHRAQDVLACQTSKFRMTLGLDYRGVIAVNLQPN